MSDKLTTYEPIARRTTYQLVAERLIELVGSRRLKPGDSIPTERELVRSFGVGRSSVREALRMLESHGLITSGGNGTFLVSAPRNLLGRSLDLLMAVEEANYGELFEARRILEGEAAALAALRRSDDELVALERTVGDMADGLGSEEAFITADLQFHLVIAAATRNRVIEQLMNAIRNLLHRSLASSYHIPGSPQRAIRAHRLILGALVEGRPEEARQRMQEHVARVERDIGKHA